MAKRLTHKEWLTKLPDVIFETFDVLDEYINRRTKMRVQCKTCDEISTKLPQVLVSGYGCVHCQSG